LTETDRYRNKKKVTETYSDRDRHPSCPVIIHK
jgi:hypothetical protein